MKLSTAAVAFCILFGLIQATPITSGDIRNINIHKNDQGTMKINSIMRQNLQTQTM